MVNIRFLNPVYFIFLILAAGLIWVFIRQAHKSGRRIAALILRIIAVICLTAGLAGTAVTTGSEQVNAVFVMDLSHSIDMQGREQGFAYINNALEHIGNQDQAGVVFFGAESSVESVLQHDLRSVSTESVIDSSASNIAEAIYSAITLFPAYGERKIYLLSDGNQTIGDAREAAAAAEAAGIQITTIPLVPAADPNEVYVKDIIVDNELRSGASHDIRVMISSTFSTRGQLTFLKDGEYMGEDRVVIPSGESSFIYSSVFEEPGIHSYEVFLEVTGDQFSENNYYQTMVRVSGKPAVLYLYAQQIQSQELLDALQVQGFSVQPMEILDLPGELRELVPYDAVIMDNIPAFDLSFRKMDMMEQYVKGLGGGFIMLGGDLSFGLGGYYKTPIESMLPVDMDVTSSMNTPSLAMVMVIDKSGSMGTSTGTSETKLEVVKEAVLSSIEVLNPFYKVGLLSFDAAYEWTVPMTDAGEKGTIINNLASLDSGGGTKLFEAMQAGYTELQRTNAAVKHLLILSDGQTDEGDFQSLTEQINASKITVSTVAIGSDSNRPLMENIADWGNGRAYFTENIQDTPRIFASESMIVSRDLTVEETFFPNLSSFNELLSGVPVQNMPPLHGFILTYNKPGAEQLISTFQDNPVLSVWQYGLGRTAAFTSDLNGRWGQDWLTWAGFPQFAGQLVRWLQRPESSRELVLKTVTIDETAHVVLEAKTEEGDFNNNLSLTGTAVSPDLEEQNFRLEQTAPGRYEGEFPASAEGEYFVSVTGDGISQMGGFSVSYAGEYRDFRPDINLLKEVALQTGGRFITLNDNDPADAFKSEGNSTSLPLPLWNWLLYAGLALFFVDILVRLIHPALIWAGITSRFRKEGKRFSYSEIRQEIARKQKEEQERSSELSYWFGKNRPQSDVDARIFIARQRQERRR